MMNSQDHTSEVEESLSIGHVQTDKRGAKKKTHVPPPVCGTHGRVLGLSATSVRARDRTTEQEAGLATTKTSVTFSAQQEHHPGESKNTKGRLKSARLQPLNVVNNAPLSSEDVLGIIPVSSISNRPRSSTSPGVQLSSGQSASSEAVGNRSRTKKRSYSAVVPRSWTVDGWEELFISKQVGLVPQTRTKQDQSQVKHSSIVGGQPQPQHPSTNRPRILPPVTSNFNRQSEDSPSAVETLKVEIKGLKIDKQPTSQKPSNDSSSPASPRLPLLIPSLSSAPNEPHNAANYNPTPSPGSSEKATKCTAHSPGVKTATESSNTCTPPPTAGKVSASIVSLGKTGSVVGSRQTRPKHVHNRHRHPSSGKQSGRLSSGWSAPKPVGNIKGTPLQVPPHPHTHTDSNKHTSEQERVVSPEMHITVTEYLLDDKQ